MSVVFQSIFKKYDANGDGKFDKEEVRFMCYDLGHFFTDAEFEAAWTLLDADGSGFIEKDEFLNFWRNEDRFTKLRMDDDQLSLLTEMSRYFQTFDKDKNGSLDRAEMKAMCDDMQRNGFKLKEMNFSVEGLDRNGDGNITFNEYIAYMVDAGALDPANGVRPVHG